MMYGYKSSAKIVMSTIFRQYES